jgi:putative thioredoxin
VGDEASLRRALELEPDHPPGGGPGPAPGRRGTPAEALELLARIPETARLPGGGGRGPPGPSRSRCRRRRRRPPRRPAARVKDDADARQEFLDLLETLGPDDPRTARYRKALSARLF